MKSIKGGNTDAVSKLQQRLAELDQQAAKLWDHLLAMNPKTAQSMDLYDQAQVVSQEREAVEHELKERRADLPTVPDPAEVKARAMQAFDHLGEVLASGTPAQAAGPHQSLSGTL